MKLELLADLWQSGKEETHLIGSVVQEELDIEGFKIDSWALLKILFEGADEDGRFGKFMKVYFGRKEVEVYISLKFERKNGTEYLPYEFSKKARVPFQKIKLALEIDPSEGRKNPRRKQACAFCDNLTTELIVVLVYGKLVVRSGLILCCGRFQKKWSFGGKVDVSD